METWHNLSVAMVADRLKANGAAGTQVTRALGVFYLVSQSAGALGQSCDLTPQQISEIIGISESTVSKILIILEDAKLIERPASGAAGNAKSIVPIGIRAEKSSRHVGNSPVNTPKSSLIKYGNASIKVEMVEKSYNHWVQRLSEANATTSERFKSLAILPIVAAFSGRFNVRELAEYMDGDYSSTRTSVIFLEESGLIELKTGKGKGRGKHIYVKNEILD